MRSSSAELTPVEVWTKYDAIEARLSAPLSERMLDLACVGPGMHVLDLATGRGEPAIRAARRVGPTGRVLGTDVSADMLTFARAASGDTPLELRVVDAQSGEGLDGAAFDVVTTRWGLMYMPAPARALEQARRALKPGGVLVAALWAEPERVAWVTFTRRVLARYCAVPPLDPGPPSACHYASLSVIARDFSAFTIERIEEMDVPVIEAATGAGIAAWCIDFGFARLANDLPAADLREFEADLAREAEALRDGPMIRLGGVTRIVVARAGISV